MKDVEFPIRDSGHSPHRSEGACCRFSLDYHAASDGGVFPDEVLEARTAREHQSLMVSPSAPSSSSPMAACHLQMSFGVTLGVVFASSDQPVA